MVWPFPILVADDAPASRHRLTALVAKWGYAAIPVADGDAALAAFNAAESPRIAILDWSIPDRGGMAVCSAIRAMRGAPYVYVILLTSKDQNDDLAAAFDAGADDCLPKPFHPSELRARLMAGRRIIGLQDELIAARAELLHRSTHDGLTGTLNHAAILAALDRELARSRRERTPIGVIMADLDRFKQVNDTYGHLAGDAVLVEAVRRIRAGVRPYDSVGRYGGEEFVVVLPNCRLAESASVAERIRAAMARGPVIYSEVSIPVTISLGAAALDDPAALSAMDLLQTADQALYRAKGAGRNCVEVAALAPARD